MCIVEIGDLDKSILIFEKVKQTKNNFIVLNLDLIQELGSPVDALIYSFLFFKYNGAKEFTKEDWFSITEKELSDKFRVSRNTVRKVIAHLIELNLIIKRKVLKKSLKNNTSLQFEYRINDFTELKNEHSGAFKNEHSGAFKNEHSGAFKNEHSGAFKNEHSSYKNNNSNNLLVSSKEELASNFIYVENCDQLLAKNVFNELDKIYQSSDIKEMWILACNDPVYSNYYKGDKIKTLRFLLEVRAADHTIITKEEINSEEKRKREREKEEREKKEKERKEKEEELERERADIESLFSQMPWNKKN